MESVSYRVREIWHTPLGDIVNVSINCVDRDYAEYKAKQIRQRNVKRDFRADAWSVEILEPTTKEVK